MKKLMNLFDDFLKPLYQTDIGRKALFISGSFFIPSIPSNSNDVFKDSSKSAYHEVDKKVANDFGLQNAIFDQVHTFYTTSGTRYDIHLAVANANDTIPGSALSGYAIKQNTSELERTVLLDSLPNTCFSILDRTDPLEVYEQDARNHWEDCGYVTTSTNDINVANLNAFPNPFSEDINITRNGINSIQMYNVLGQIVYENKDVKDNFYKIHGTNLAPGLYFIRVNQKETKKVIKK